MGRGFVLASLILVVPCGVHAEENPAEEAVAAYQRGLELQARDPSAAREQFRLAVASYEKLLDSGHANAPLFCNLGHACLMGGDTGRAVHFYRRAELLDPGNVSVQAGLQQVGTLLGKHARPQAAWNVERYLGPWPTLAVGLGAFALGWLCVLGFWRTRRRWLLVPALPLIITGLFLTGSIAEHGWYEQRFPAGVVVEATPLREGNASSFRAVADGEPPPGAEFRMLAQKDEWLRVQLGDGTRGWLPLECVLLAAP